MKNTNLHFGDFELNVASSDKLNVNQRKYDDKKIISYDVFDGSSMICRIQCSVKYIIVVFVDSKNGFLYNKRTKQKELFELKDCETIQTDSGIDINKFNISKYITNEFEFEFSYDKDNNNVAQVTMSYVPDQRVDLFTMDADHKDFLL